MRPRWRWPLCSTGFASASFDFVDTQMLTEHTERLGAFEIPRERYLEMLKIAISKPGVRF